MATSSSGEREERRGEEESGEEEEREGDRGGIPRLVCSSCGHSQSVPCEKCRNVLSQQVNIGRVRKLIMDANIFTDCRSGEETDRPAELRRSPRGDIYMESVGSLVLSSTHTNIDLGPDGRVKASVAHDLEQVEKVPDNTLLLECHWPKDPLPSAQKEALLIKMIDKRSDKFYRKVVAKIQEAGVPEGVMRTLYNQFQLKLLGMTKGLEVLMEGSADTVKEVMGSRSVEVQQQLAQFVPEEQRGQVEWGEWLSVPVQCCDDLQRLSKGQPLLQVKEDSPETVRGAIDLACRYGNYKTLRKLLQHRYADVRTPDTEGRTPFHIACRYGQSHLLDLLLDKGAAIHEPDLDGWSPLHHACGAVIGKEHKRLKTVRWLLDHGGHVDAANRDRHTPVDLAKMAGQQSTVQLLLSPPPHGERDDGKDDPALQ